MALIVEDGTGIAGANSYVSVADHIAYAALYGKTVNATQAEINLRKAMDYIESKTYKGTKEFTINNLKFPRTDVVVHGETLTDAQAQEMITRAQNELAIGINDGYDPLATQSGQTVASESFGPMSKTYATNKTSAPSNPRVDLFLNPLLLQDNGMFHFKVTNEKYHGCC